MDFSNLSCLFLKIRLYKYVAILYQNELSPCITCVQHSRLTCGKTPTTLTRSEHVKKVVNKANSTVTGYAYGNLNFRHYQCITFAAWSLNNFEGSLSYWWNSLLMFFVFSWFITLPSLGIIVAWHNLQYASCEPSLAFFNQRNVFSRSILPFRPLS